MLLGELTYLLLCLSYPSCKVFAPSLLSVFMKAHPLCLFVLVWRVVAKKIVWSCTLLLLYPHLLYRLKGGGCCLESFGSTLSAVNHSRLLYKRGKRLVQRRSPGRMSAIREMGIEDREKGGEGKLGGRRRSRRRKWTKMNLRR